MLNRLMASPGEPGSGSLGGGSLGTDATAIEQAK